jgi:hypothetical protein
MLRTTPSITSDAAIPPARPADPIPAEPPGTGAGGNHRTRVGPRRIALAGLVALACSVGVPVAASGSTVSAAGPALPATTDLGTAPFRPEVTIKSPTPALYTQVESRLPKVFLDAEAVDPQDGPISGTRLRWTAQSLEGTKTLTLCVGSNFPAGSGSTDRIGITAVSDCSEATVELPAGRWAIVAEAADRDGNLGAARVNVEVRFKAL